MAKDKNSPLVDLIGQVERITYSDEASGFTIAQVQPAEGRETVTVVGDLMCPSPGTVLKMQGHWSEHPKFGRQFKAMTIDRQHPVTLQGIEKYIGSGLIKGIGPETARRIVSRFKDNTLDIIAQQPERLAEVPRIGAKRIAVIRKAWQEQAEIRQVMLFLQSHGVSPAYAVKIFRQYGRHTVAVISKNPYQLADDIFGIGFLTADSIAGKLGFKNDTPLRLQAGILYVLHQLADEGHLFYPQEDLIAKSRAILKSPHGPIVSALEALSASRQIVIENLNISPGEHQVFLKAVYLSQFHQCEKFIAQRLHMLMGAPLYHATVDLQQALQWVQSRLSLELARNQQEAIAQALASKVLVITGGPGTGKTTIVQAITRLYEHLHAGVLLAAPTGRAAKRLSEATGRPAKTLHRLLEYNPQQGGFQRNQHNPLDGDLLVVDEASMIDAVLMYHLLKAVPVTFTLILVGDANQLPSVGPGNVLKDVLNSRTVPQVALRQIFRQARNSRIIINAHRINAGRLPNLDPVPAGVLGDFYFISQDHPEKILATILTLVRERIPQRFGLDAVDDIQVITPMHRGVIGAQNLNRQLQQTLNHQDAYVARGELLFGLHDKVMQVRNNYEKNVFNGDIGRITQIDAHNKTVSIRFDHRVLRYDFDEMDELVLAYAISVHKSQGSEYPAVVIPVSTQHYLLLQRNLIYTGITRAKRLVVLVGTQQALAMAVKNNTPHQRHTCLAQRLISMQAGS